MMEIIADDDTDRVVDLGETIKGLHMPYNHTMLNAVTLLNWSGK